MIPPFEKDIINCLDVLHSGGIILYPTDTIWGIGCDAMNEQAVKKIYDLKQRQQGKSMIVLVAEDRSILHYVAAPDPRVFDFIAQQTRPTTIVFENAIGLPDNIVAPDGTIAIRVVKDEFCRHLIKRFRKPVISTSANTSGLPACANFIDIEDEIKEGVDYIVNWRQEDNFTIPSQVIRWNNNGFPTILRT
jgi:L-threonylcarbamoyladenylate synthase